MPVLPHRERQLRGSRGVGEGLGWFPVQGRRVPDRATARRRNGFAWERPPPETVDFLHYLVSLDRRRGALNSGILPTPRLEPSRRPHASLVLDGRAKPRSCSCTSTSDDTGVGGAINEAVATLYAGTGTPQSVVDAINQAAAQ